MKFLDTILQCLGLIRFSIYKKDTEKEYDKFIKKIDQINSNKIKFYYQMLKWQSTKDDKPLYSFVIYQEFEDKSLPNNTIKTLSTDDYEYGVLCAQELCDKLNESI